VGGARLGPGARGAPPRASTFSGTSSVSAKSGGTIQAALSRDVGADTRCGSARTVRWCESCRRCAAANGFVSNATGSVCLTTHRSTSLARAPPVMDRAYSPKRTATRESRKEAEGRRTMRVPASSYTFKTLAASSTLATGESFADIEETQKRGSRVVRVASPLIEFVVVLLRKEHAAGRTAMFPIVVLRLQLDPLRERS
jgi:hypothetical protein